MSQLRNWNNFKLDACLLCFLNWSQTHDELVTNSKIILLNSVYTLLFVVQEKCNNELEKFKTIHFIESLLKIFLDLICTDQIITSNRQFTRDIIHDSCKDQVIAFCWNRMHAWILILFTTRFINEVKFILSRHEHTYIVLSLKFDVSTPISFSGIKENFDLCERWRNNLWRWSIIGGEVATMVTNPVASTSIMTSYSIEAEFAWADEVKSIIEC